MVCLPFNHNAKQSKGFKMSLIDKIDNTVYSYATLRQKEIIDAVTNAKGNQAQAARDLGIKHQTVTVALSAAINRATKQGYSPDHDMTHPAPDGYFMRESSNLYGANGEIKLQWIKNSIDKERQGEMIQQAVRAAVESMPRLKPVNYEGLPNSELLNQITITDYHIGMLAWHEEGGDNWNIDIAEKTLIRAFSYLIANSPNADTCIINQLGDFLHFDGLKPVTPASGHVLDGESRFHQMIRVAIKCLRAMVDMALVKHTKVHLICAEGNHDESSAHWLQELFTVLYEDDPRVTVDNSPKVYYCYQHGKTMLAYHHGHCKGRNKLLPIIPALFPEIWGATKFRYVHEGHMHHKEVNENDGIAREMHQTLAAADAYSSRGGYVSERATTCITYSKQHGEVARILVKPSMLDLT
jgi:hypothetical protein